MSGRGSINVVAPGAYTVSGSGGDIRASEGQGLFYRDTRHLSRFELRIDGVSPAPLEVLTRGSRAEFSMAARSGDLRLARRRVLGGGMEEEILLSNATDGPLEVRVELECEADFEDIFAVRGFAQTLERGETSEEVMEGALRYTYLRDGFSRGTVVRVFAEGAEPVVERGRISLRLRVGVGEGCLVRVSVKLEEGGEEVRGVEHAPLYVGAPGLETGPALRRSWERSVEDLESLTFDAGDGLLVPAAGAPWFMALFGRDSLITAYQAMILSPEPARNVLRVLARHQATGRDDFTDAEPGKIAHEFRRGEMAFFGEIPETPYYGTVDATPLFLILLHETWRWTADEDFAREMEGAARRALGWILDHSDKTGDGYVAYATRSTAGLRNQGWKDHFDSMLFRDGTHAEDPIAPCEVQGYVYDAFLRTVELAERAWADESLAADLRERARDLKERFDRDYWMEDRRYYALALDGSGRRVDSTTSNAGHLLWSGIVPEEKARLVTERLMGEELFSGWGVRTMAVGEGGYDPDSYHNGSVWPHDNSIIAEGLRRYGLRSEANRIATALVEAVPHFDYRLPEVFAGYPRNETAGPVEYPTSCIPQAWAAGTVPLLVRTMLGLEPDPQEQRLDCAPVLPPAVESLRLDGVPAFGEEHAAGVRG